MSHFDPINTVLSTYFDGLYFADPERLKKVFHPQALYASADQTPLLYLNMTDYFDVVSKRESPASKNQTRHDVVESIELAGENTALARVRCSIDTRDFVDFLSLVRTDGEWRIMAKVFQITERA